MIIAPIITRLATICTLATAVREAPSINAALSADIPIIYVAPFSEVAEPSRYDNIIGHTITATVQLTIGAAVAADALEALRAQVFSALLGFIPATGYDAMEYENGDLVDITNGIIWWRDSYKFRYFVRQS